MHWDLQSIKWFFFFHLKETERPVWNNYKLNLGMKKSDEIWFKKSQMLISYNLEYLTTPYQIVWKFLKLKKKAIKFWNDKKVNVLFVRVFSEWSPSPRSPHLLVQSWQLWHWCWVFGAGTGGIRTLSMMTFWSL